MMRNPADGITAIGRFRIFDGDCRPGFHFGFEGVASNMSLVRMGINKVKHRAWKRREPWM